MKKIKYKNQFLDSFEILKDGKRNITNVKKNITHALNKLLPSRILSKANIFNISIDVSQELSKMIMLNVEDSLIENNILIAQKPLSVRGLATLSGHVATRGISSKGEILITFKPSAFLKSPFIIFENPIFKFEGNNLQYYSKSNVTITSSNIEKSFVLTEGERVKNDYIVEGYKLEKIELDNNLAIENSNIEVFVNSEKYKQFDCLYDMKSTSKGFIVKNGIGNQVDIIFGDDINGRKLENGDKVEVYYMVTNGEYGNIDFENESLNQKFKIVSGVTDNFGVSIDINDDIIININSGFVFGSNGEDIEKTRMLSGYNSKSLVFTRPENLMSYLSRLSTLSHIDVWTDNDSNIYKILALPNLMNKINEYTDYLNIGISELTLNDNQKKSLIDYIEGSDAQSTSTELLFVEPTFKKYAIFVYIKGNVIDKNTTKKEIQSQISKVFIENTLTDFDIENYNITITKNEIIENIISNVSGIDECTITIKSEENEVAKINGYYKIENEVHYGATKKIVEEVIYLTGENENPNLGFNELGSICTHQRSEIPILRGDFKIKNNSENNPIIELDEPIYIFLKQDTTYESI